MDPSPVPDTSTVVDVQTTDTRGPGHLVPLSSYDLLLSPLGSSFLLVSSPTTGCVGPKLDSYP